MNISELTARLRIEDYRLFQSKRTSRRHLVGENMVGNFDARVIVLFVVVEVPRVWGGCTASP